MAEVIDSLALLLPALVLAVTVHEAAHALVATLFGDRLARASGRVSINPLRHCSWWGKAVPIGAPLASSRMGLLCTALAGPLASLALRPIAGHGGWLAFLETSASLNLFLCVVNLLPLRPLDGATCIQALCGEQWWPCYESLQPYLHVVAAGLLFTGLLGQYVLWVARTLLNFLPGGLLHG